MLHEFYKNKMKWEERGRGEDDISIESNIKAWDKIRQLEMHKKYHDKGIFV